MKILRKMVICFTFTAVVSCTGNNALSGDKVLRMATTTSTDNTGLIDYLAPYIQADTGIELKWVAVGTGKAFVLGKNCDVDVLMVHAPDAENQYVDEGHGICRSQIMYNDFVIIGPKNDPARIKGKAVSEALNRIVEKSASFASRGDDSGTNKKEMNLWKSAGLPVPDREQWYIQTGQGMLSTINIAAEIGAYTLTDRGTFLKYESNYKGHLRLVILIEGHRSLRNQYSVIAINPDRCKNAQFELTMKFINWITSSRARKLIGDFKLLGKQLFIPNACEH